MKTLNIEAYSFNEAKEIAAAQGVTVVKNVTPSYKKVNPDNLDDFGAEILAKNKVADGSGVIVVVEPGSADTRERPYTFNNHKSDGNMTKKRVFEVYTTDGRFVGSAENKHDAVVLAKANMKNFKNDMVCQQVYRVDAAHETVFDLTYTPAAGTKKGSYIVFCN